MFYAVLWREIASSQGLCQKQQQWYVRFGKFSYICAEAKESKSERFSQLIKNQSRQKQRFEEEARNNAKSAGWGGNALAASINQAREARANVKRGEHRENVNLLNKLLFMFLPVASRLSFCFSFFLACLFFFVISLCAQQSWVARLCWLLLHSFHIFIFPNMNFLHFLRARKLVPIPCEPRALLWIVKVQKFHPTWLSPPPTELRCVAVVSYFLSHWRLSR